MTIRKVGARGSEVMVAPRQSLRGCDGDDAGRQAARTSGAGALSRSTHAPRQRYCFPVPFHLAVRGAVDGPADEFIIHFALRAALRLWQFGFHARHDGSCRRRCIAYRDTGTEDSDCDCVVHIFTCSLLDLHSVGFILRAHALHLRWEWNAFCAVVLSAILFPARAPKRAPRAP